MLEKRRQGPITSASRGTWLMLVVYSLIGLCMPLAMLFFSEFLGTLVIATIVLIPATGLVFEVRRRRRARMQQWARSKWQQEQRSRGEERTRANAAIANDELPRPWWDVLQIAEQSTLEDVKAAYRARIKQYHPDKVTGLAREFQELADRKTKEINRAYRQALRTHRAKSPDGE